MTTNLKTLGSELAVIIDRSTLEALGIDESTRLEVSVDEGDIRIRPIPDEHRARVLSSARRMMDIHDETFRKLAQ
jgi:antitoxin component of MazEF toxin-antitoxin module